MNARIGTTQAEVIVDGEDSNGMLLTLCYEPAAGERTVTFSLTMAARGDHGRGDYTFDARQDGDLARKFFRSGVRPSLDQVAGIARQIRTVAERLVEAGKPV